MKAILNIAFASMLLSACAGQSDSQHEVADIITVTDNGTTYSDTMHWELGGELVAVGRATEGNAMVKEATGGKSVQSANASLDELALQCSIHKKDGKSIFTLIHAVPSAGFPFSLSIANAVGPGGVGVYKTTGHKGAEDLSQVSSFAETEMNGGPYTVDSVEVNVTKAEGSSVNASFKIWVTGAGQGKTVSGTLQCNTADVTK